MTHSALQCVRWLAITRLLLYTVRLVRFWPSSVYPHSFEGPPGTGKTTTITAAAQVWDSRKISVWIVAHSNVAVKNIAEKLFDKEVNFKILVSKEFHEEWLVVVLSICSDRDNL